jgi:hypothetical protein
MHISAAGALVTHQAHLLPHLHFIPERHLDAVEGEEKKTPAILLDALNHEGEGGIEPQAASAKGRKRHGRWQEKGREDYPGVERAKKRGKAKE